MVFYPILLPWPILLHAVGLAFLGSSMLFSNPAAQVSEDTSVLGIATIGLGMSYISTSYMPIEENQFLYASAPVRVVLALLAGMKWLSIRRRGGPGMTKIQNTLLGIFAYDGLGGLILGWYLGTWGGKVAGYR